MFRVEIPRGSSLLIDGPAVIEALEGPCRVFGAEVKRLEVPRYRRYPVEGPCYLAVEGGSAIFLEGRAVPEDWDLDLSGSALIAGPTDSGKSSLATYLLNRAVAEGRYVCVVDADVGQSDIGPPGLISYSCTAAKTPHISLLEPLGAFFLGSTNLAGLEELALAGVVATYAEAKARYPHLIIINTPGWAAGRGLQLLWAIKAAVRPDVVLGLGGVQLGGRALSTPAAVRARDREERAAIRSAQYARFLKGLRRISASAEALKFPCRWERGVLSCLWADYEPGDVEEPKREEGRRYKVPKERLRGLFAALYRRGELAGFGVVVELGEEVRLEAATDDFDEVRAGKIRVRRDGLELEPLP
ncbi:MAG: Clp1/GlmU family protein [Thermoproteus sp. AZ2]|uniref:Clp1/GlmU family protein n=1 Tax=Thermoproteus sp. AZ2 TaxID=1609232 RepID=A0ACC6V2A3_9CREN|nr:MAG: hypothetical protein TU35_05705 [Thermoproteus sp. AZ2]